MFHKEKKILTYVKYHNITSMKCLHLLIQKKFLGNNQIQNLFQNQIQIQIKFSWFKMATFCYMTGSQMEELWTFWLGQAKNTQTLA